MDVVVDYAHAGVGGWFVAPVVRWEDDLWMDIGELWMFALKTVLT